MAAADTYRGLLAQVLREQDLSVAEAAQICRVPYPTFVALLHGGSTLTLEGCDAMLRKLGVRCRIVRDV